MKQYTVTFVTFLIGLIFSTHAIAEEYEYDINVSYGNSSTDLKTPIAIIGGDPASTFGTAVTSIDSDALEVSGTWYYSGLSDNEGPKSRAAFLSRASGISLAFSYADESSSFSSTGLPTSPPSNVSSDGTTRELKAGLRHVWQSSGWYALAGATRFESKLDSGSATRPGFFSSDVDGSVNYVGVGKYIGDATALDFKLTTTEIGGLDSTVYALSLSHIGSLGAEWQYAADLGFSLADSDVGDDNESYLAGLSLFPTANFEFGVQLTHQENHFSPDLDSYKGFAGWFVRDDIELRAWYEHNDFDRSAISDVDSNQFGIGVNVRF